MRSPTYLAIVAALLQGCAMNQELQHDAVAYETTIDELTDRFLVENILQARDKAPLHFVDIASIHEAIQTGATLGATLPFGKHNGATTRASTTAGLSIQVSPSFDVTHLDSKDFVTGIASPIDAKFVKYWLDRGLDGRVVLLLFGREIDVTDTSTGETIKIRNSPRESLQEIMDDEVRAHREEKHFACSSSEFSRYLAIVNTLNSQISTNVYTERTQIGEEFTLDNAAQLKQLTSLDTSKFALEQMSGRSYRLFSTSPNSNYAICFARKSGAELSPMGFHSSSSPQTDVCTARSVTKYNLPLPATAPPPPTKAKATKTVYLTKTATPVKTNKGEFLENVPDENKPYCRVFKGFADPASLGDYKVTISLRSVGEMIQFLGDLSYYQEELERKVSADHWDRLCRHNVPLTIGYQSNEDVPCPTLSKEGGALLNLHAKSDLRFSVHYRNEDFDVAKFSPGDHTLEVLSVLHQVIDLNKSATDLRSTPTVQIVP